MRPRLVEQRQRLANQAKPPTLWCQQSTPPAFSMSQILFGQRGGVEAVDHQRRALHFPRSDTWPDRRSSRSASRRTASADARSAGETAAADNVAMRQSLRFIVLLPGRSPDSRRAFPGRADRRGRRLVRGDRRIRHPRAVRVGEEEVIAGLHRSIHALLVEAKGADLRGRRRPCEEHESASEQDRENAHSSVSPEECCRRGADLSQTRWTQTAIALMRAIRPR